MYGSMTGKDALKTAEEVHAKKQDVGDRKAASVANRSLQKETFYLCKTKCNCEDQVEYVQHQTLGSALCTKEYFYLNVLS